MIVAKLRYRSPSFKVYGSARDVPLSNASPQVTQAMHQLAEKGRKALERRNRKQD